MAALASVTVAMLTASCGAAATGGPSAHKAADVASATGNSLPRAINHRYLGFSAQGFPPSASSLADLETQTHVLPNLISMYTGPATPFNSQAADAIADQGALPLVQIDPDSQSLAGFAAGRDDSWLRRYADAVAAFDHPVAIGFAHEFNAPWTPWSFQHEDPAVFVAAWRHVVSVFRAQGATNVVWVWTINVNEDGTVGDLSAWWPGTDYVTWVGVDGYFFTDEAFGSVFGPTFAQVRRFTAKPILITETGVDPGATRPTQIINLFQAVETTPGLIGFIWFNYDKTTDHDWLLNNDPAALAAFSEAAHDYWTAPAPPG